MSRVLLLNPWIEDFAAYDLWLRPLGLLQVASMLREAGADVFWYDTLARELDSSGKARSNGTGKFTSKILPTPPPISWVKRCYRRYGQDESTVEERLRALPRPDWVLLSTVMTYWYGGAMTAARLVRRLWPGVRVMLGGVYARLCTDHAESCQLFDVVVPEKSPRDVAAVLARHLHLPVNDAAAFSPAWDLYEFPLQHAALLTGTGCPCRCSYCAAPVMYPEFRRLSMDAVMTQIKNLIARKNPPHLAFYDDALLVDRETFAKPLLRHIIKHGWPVRFHLPNAVHPGCIDEEMALLMREAGFETIRLGFESLDEELQIRSSRKAGRAVAETAARNLQRAGFDGKNVGAYVLVGVPGQSLAATQRDAEFVHQQGWRICLATWSPIPETQDYLRELPRYPEWRTEPLLHNTTVMAERLGQGYRDLKQWCDQRNASLMVK